MYTASYAALPELAAIAARHAPAGYVAAVHLVASIIASEDGPTDAADVRKDHTDVLAGPRNLAEASLALARDDTEFVYGLESLMAFEDGGVWQRCLDHVADDEMPMACPACGATLVLDLSGEEFALVDYHDASVRATIVHPGDAAPGTVDERLLALADAFGCRAVEEKVKHLVGEADCPSCGSRFHVPDAPC